MVGFEEHEARVRALLEQEGALRSWLEAMRGVVKDGEGRTVILGLSADETIEFLNLHGPVIYDKSNRSAQDQRRQRDRYFVLREKHDDARRRDAAENSAFWIDKPRCQ